MPPKKTAEVLTMDHLRSTKKPQQFSTWIVTDQDLVDEFEAVTESLEQARSKYRMLPNMDGLFEEVGRLEDELEALRLKVTDEKHSLKFTFQSVGSGRYERLMAEHPLTEEKREQLVKQGFDTTVITFDVDTFSIALVAESSFEPKMTEDFVRDEIVNCSDGSWSQGEFQQLYTAALHANVRQRNPSMGKGFKRTIR